jgi:hypothetical protein
VLDTASLESVRAQVGRRFPGGEYTVEAWRAWLLDDAILEPPGGEIAHPVFVWMAATTAKGISWETFFTWFGATSADGPMFGECDMALHRPLQVGATYLVTGEVTSAERKTGRTTGPFDVVGYQFALHDKDSGQHVADCWNSIIFPRRSP